MVEHACKICRRLVKGNICPVDKSTDLTRNWRGVVVVINPEKSEIAKKAELNSPGRFAIKIKI
ncbi:MAG: transcription elongation factor subunit Spt4 [Candidatus Aenigmatarchaeota archaeon]